MSGVLAVVPVISAHTADITVPSMTAASSSLGLPHSDILVIDNTREGWADKYGLPTYRDPSGHNLGVARAWNVGVDHVLGDSNKEYLLIVSASLQFGPTLHTTWLEQMERFWGENVIECDGHSWHLIAFHRRVFEMVGHFDGNFYPAYEEAVDFGYRMRMLGLEGGWTRCWVNAMSLGHALHINDIRCPNPPLAKYYRQKWGGAKGEERWTLPFGDKPIGYFVQEPIPKLAQKYGLGEYGTGWW